MDSARTSSRSKPDLIGAAPPGQPLLEHARTVSSRSGLIVTPVITQMAVRPPSFWRSSRPPECDRKLAASPQFANRLKFPRKLGGYRMGQVNSHGESRRSERSFGRLAAWRGQRRLAENRRIPELQRAERRAERLSPEGFLADGEDSNSRYPIGPNLQGGGSVDEEGDLAKSLILSVSGWSSR
jgi:hypothetical protein